MHKSEFLDQNDVCLPENEKWPSAFAFTEDHPSVLFAILEKSMLFEC